MNDDNEHGDEYVYYDYQDYYENNLDYKPFRDVYRENNEERTSERKTTMKKAKPVEKPGQIYNRNLLTTLAPLILDFKFSNDRVKVMKAQEEMFDRIMHYSSQI